MEKFSVKAVLEAKDDDNEKRSAKVGEWSGDDLIVRTYPISDLIDRIVKIGYDFKSSKVMEKKIRKILPEIIKKDRNYAMATIDILSDKSIHKSEMADLIDNNVDEFVESHEKELSAFKPYKRA